MADPRTTIENLSTLLKGRTVIDVRQCVYRPEDFADDPPLRPLVADFPCLLLDDGSEVVLLDGWGMPPIAERVQRGGG